MMSQESPINYETSPTAGLHGLPSSSSSAASSKMDIWDLRLKQESERQMGTPTTTHTQSPSLAGALPPQSLKPSAAQQRPHAPAPLSSEQGGLEALMKSNPQLARQIKYKIAEVVLARSGSSSTKMSDEDVNALLDALARELAPANSSPDGRMTVDTEVEWNGAAPGPLAQEDSDRPLAPVNDRPTALRGAADPAVLAGPRGVSRESCSSKGSAHCVRPRVAEPSKHRSTHQGIIMRESGRSIERSGRSAFSECSENSYVSSSGMSTNARAL